ncbi:hypothetical protein BJ322DRAFT_1026940 [Thelephora terrestris]|uniref:DUF7918 domain-containing protein n=1 Tax=Thelephora terrestris TaxID=56493 RepID=A0A9P6HNV8_9AGAM|nr:hypothetical protein BJ322DRAFT_1026940 [Thelephora terrestris]
MVLRLHGYGAWVESDGKPLEEYAVEIKGNVISCYICSEEGKEFALNFDDDGSHLRQFPAPFETYGRVVKIKMDGPDVDCLWGEFMGELKSRGMRVGDILRPYVFAPIDTTDDDDVATRDDPNIEHIGTIQVELMRAARIGPGVIGYQRGPGPSAGPIHERSKKAGSHRVAFGEAVYKPQNPVRVHYIDQNPLLIFRFLYRKRDILKAQGILPQSPSPPPPPVNLPGPSVKDKGLRNKGKGVKRERDEDGDGGLIEVFSDNEDIETLQDELKRIQDRIARKKAKKPVKREPADDIIDLT